MLIENDIQLDFKDVMFAPQRSTLSSRSEVNLIRNYKFKNCDHEWSGVPIIAANMDTVGTMKMSKALSMHQCMTALHKHYSTEELVDFFTLKQDEESIRLLHSNQHHLLHTFYSMGITNSDLEKFESVVDKVGYWDSSLPLEKNSGIKFVCIDVANGYMQVFVDFCKKMRKRHPKVVLMAGNIVSGDIAQELILSGVCIVKAGIGGGSVCTTRYMTGVGRPQLSTIIDCSNATHGLLGHICSDGGITSPGDAAKAFGAGADFLMLGGMLSGHIECEMESFTKDGKEYFHYYGMSSEKAMNKHSGGVAKHRASEGKIVEILSKGSVNYTIQEILGGLRSTCTYLGCKNLKEINKRTKFYRVTMQTNDIYGKPK
jgi:GMP reductase